MRQPRQMIAKTAAFLIAVVLCGCSKSEIASQLVGAPQGAIIGGQEVDSSDPIAKSTVALFLNVGGMGDTCTGTLIAKNLVITAAHCLGKSPLTEVTVIFSNSTDKWNKANSRPVVAAAANGRYTALKALSSIAPNQRNQDDVKFYEESGWGDIAIIRFAGSLPPGYAPVQIMPQANILRDGTMLTLAGFGHTDPRLNAPVLPNGKTVGRSGILNKIDMPIAKALYKKGEFVIDQRSGKGACRGDSGGPAYIKDRNGKYWLAGITSHGEGQNGYTCLTITAFTNVASYRLWIDKMAPALLLVNANKSVRPNNHFIPVRVTEADVIALNARR